MSPQEFSYQPPEWRRDISDPNQLFDREVAIARPEYIVPAQEVEIDNSSVARGHCWAETVNKYGSGEHRLCAVVNIEGNNLGIAETVIEGKSVTYITAMAKNKDDRAELLAILDTPPGDQPTSFSLLSEDLSSRPLAERDVALVVNKYPSGRVGVMNASTNAVRLGLGEEIKPEPKLRERFSPRAVLGGLKKVLFGEEHPKQAGPNKYPAFVGTTNWMSTYVPGEDYSLAEFAIHMRQHDAVWYVASPE
ncbi:MAG TPA: hypothetical protein VLA92_00505 [Candidatus Saccharimonadales bacterium]|nr:hypothetical protein [Candidatus Saccharimonadales bacterium]